MGLLSHVLFAQKVKSDANIVGHVVCKNEHIPFAHVYVKGTTIGITTDETGHFQLLNLPVGEHTVSVKMLGYKPSDRTISISKGETKEIKFEIEEDVLGLDEIVVTGDRNEKSRKESSVIVNTISAQLFETTQSSTLNEGLNFSPGLRMEYNCQNCGFSQVRMNGLEGPYSQILINSRPIFSGLAGVYGLELIPSSMVERIEVIRGGGSALYGSNAIAGTINLILKDPISSSYEFGASSGLSGIGLDGADDPAEDYNVHFNASLISADNKTGLAIYGYYRDRSPFDANNDSFSELTELKNTTVGSRFFHRFGYRSKVTVDFFHIEEDRRGGDRFDYPVHEAFIAEAVQHGITTGAITYEQFFRDTDLWSVFASAQKVNRGSYYGANQSLKDYGDTKGLTSTIGTQYVFHGKKGSGVIGLENRHDQLLDKKLGYLDFENATLQEGEWIVPHTENTTVADQVLNTFGAFAQYEMTFGKLNVSAGARFDMYNVKDKENGSEDKNGQVISPRLTLKYDIFPDLQFRASYSQGYRAPQIFDEDLHILTSGSRKVVHENDPDLKQETSHSFMGSFDYKTHLANTIVSFLAEGFYTKLVDAFANEYGDPDEMGTVVYTRVNADGGAIVKGVNFELNVSPANTFYVKSGFTFQKSTYEEVQEFDEKKFFRTPETYGYIALDWDFAKGFCWSVSGNYTGKMLNPYFGVEMEELRESDPFFDFGSKISYTTKLNGASIQFYTGVKNIFNSYQDDFDSGIDRDPGYVYGPGLPRTIYVGFKIGNLL